MRKGFVTGKFYPPHRGHKHLINTAVDNADKVVVAVVENKQEEIPGKVRARWLREIHPEVNVIVIPDIEKGGSPAWAEYTRLVLGYTPDVVFTSEDYGETWAHHLGCEHHLVDKQRERVPVSATQIRSNPLAHFEYMEPCVRAHFTRRVVVVGAASTGTTTMARALANHYDTRWVPEYGRLYASGFESTSDQTLSEDDFVHIARSQNRLEDQFARNYDHLLVADTNSLATHLWYEHYHGSMSERVQKASADRPVDLYLLTDTDIPFEQDGTQAGKAAREKMHDRFKEELSKRDTPHVLLSGEHEQRMEQAIAACKEILDKEYDVTGTYSNS
jgi:NadR type nicotinamide-nucleotide adenylyltransferase